MDTRLPVPTGQGGANPLGRLGEHLAPSRSGNSWTVAGGRGSRHSETETETRRDTHSSPRSSVSVRWRRDPYRKAEINTAPLPPHGRPHFPRALGVDDAGAQLEGNAGGSRIVWVGGDSSLGPMSSPSQGGSPGSLQAPDLVPQQPPREGSGLVRGAESLSPRLGTRPQTDRTVAALVSGGGGVFIHLPYLQERQSIPQPVFDYLLLFSDF